MCVIVVTTVITRVILISALLCSSNCPVQRKNSSSHRVQKCKYNAVDYIELGKNVSIKTCNIDNHDK